MAWDDQDGLMIVHGGYTYNYTLLGDTWFYYPSNGTWVRMKDGPKAAHHTAVWDTKNDQMLVFGGWDGTKSTGDLWRYKPRTDNWTSLTPLGAPRVNHSAAWDSTDNKMLVFGGGWSGYNNNELWEYDPFTDTWTQRASGATSRIHHVAGWDPVEKVMYIFAGGIFGTGQDLWAYSPGSDSWTRKADWTEQAGRDAAVYDTNRNELLVFLPSSTPTLGKLIAYNAASNAWAVRTTGSVGPRDCPGVWDAQGNRMLLFSGTTMDQEVWSYTSTSVTWSCPSYLLPASYHSAIWDDQNNKMMVFNGDNGVTGALPDETWAYDSSTGKWERKPQAPQYRYSGTAVWDPVGKRALIFGGKYSYAPLKELWMYTTSTGKWDRRADAPLGHIYHTAVWDTKHGQMIVYGGYDQLAYLEGVYIYNLSADRWTWINQAPSGPGPRAHHSAVWDELNNVMIVLGGEYYDGSAHHSLDDVWTYEPETNKWTNIGKAPTTRYDGQGVWDTAHERMLVIGGWLTYYTANPDDWSFDLRTRKFTVLPGLYPLGLDMTAVWDRKNNQVLTFGGAVIRSYRSSFLQPGTLTARGHLLSVDFYSIEKVDLRHLSPIGTGLTIETRVSHNGASWTDWETVAPKGAPAAQDRYIQWRALMNTSRPSFSPYLYNVTVFFKTNKLPVVDVSAPQSGLRNQDINMNASATDRDGDALTYRWSQTSGPSVELAGSADTEASFTSTIPGNFTFEFIANDGYNDSANVSVGIEVVNQAPEAFTDEDKFVYRKAQATLKGSGQDPEGDGLEYHWTQVGGPSVTILNPAASVASFTPIEPGKYTFLLMVSDIYGGRGVATMNVTAMNRLPSVFVNSPLQTLTKSTVNVTATGNDEDGDPLKYIWTKKEGGTEVSITNGSATLSLTPLEVGKYVFEVVVNDTYNDSEPALAEVNVINRVPQITMASNIRGIVGVEVVLSSAAKDDDGDPLSYIWAQAKGVTVYLKDRNTQVARFVPEALGEYGFLLTVNDTHASVTATVTVTVEPTYPALEFKSTPPTNAEVGKQLKYTPNTEGGRPNATKSFSLLKGPTGMAFAGVEIKWTPSKDQLGVQYVSLSVSDGHSTMYQNWTITVVERSSSRGAPESSMILIGVSLVAVIAAIVAVVVLLKRRKKEATPTAVLPPPAQGQAEAPPPGTSPSNPEMYNNSNQGGQKTGVQYPPAQYPTDGTNQQQGVDTSDGPYQPGQYPVAGTAQHEQITEE